MTDTSPRSVGELVVLLVKLLRSDSDSWADAEHRCHDAADALEALAAQVAELERTSHEQGVIAEQMTALVSERQDHIAALAAENARLLKKVVALYQPPAPTSHQQALREPSR